MKQERWQTLGMMTILLCWGAAWGWADTLPRTEMVDEELLRLFARGMVLVHGLMFTAFALIFCLLVFIEGLVWGGFIAIEKERS